QVMARIRAAGTTIVFVNTRAQAELMFQALWRLNEPTLPIALHHGSLEVEQRQRVEAAMAAGQLRGGGASPVRGRGLDRGGGGHGASGGCCKAWGAQITGWMRQAAPFWYRPTASRCWNAKRRS